MGYAAATSFCAGSGVLCTAGVTVTGGVAGSIMGSSIDGKPSAYVSSGPLPLPGGDLPSTSEPPSNPDADRPSSEPNRTPSSHERQISLSDLSPKSVTALNQINEIKGLGTLAQNLTLIGTIPGLLNPKPTDAIFSWSGLPDTVTL